MCLTGETKQSRQIDLLSETDTNPDRRSPFQKFVDQHVKPAGLYMERLAVDYIVDIPASSTSAQLVGVSIRTGLILTPGVPMPGQPHGPQPPAGNAAAFIRVMPGAEGPALGFSKALVYSYMDVWSISTDAYGKTVITTKMYGNNGMSVTYYLASNDDNTTVGMRKLPLKTDPGGQAAYDKALAHAQWTVTTLADPTTVGTTGGKEKQPLSMLVSIVQDNRTLVLELEPGTFKPKLLQLYDPDKQKSQNKLPYALAFVLDMQPVGPETMTYSRNPWELQADENVYPNFIIVFLFPSPA